MANAEGEPAPKKRLQGTPMRVATALPLIALVLYLIFFAPRWAFQVGMLVAVAIASREALAMNMPGARMLHAVGVIGSLAITTALMFAVDSFHGLPAGVFAMAALLTTLLVSLLAVLVWPDPIPSASQRIGWLLGVGVYVGVPVAALDALHARPHGQGWVLLVILLAALSDTGAYFAGRAFGKNKLYEKLSPKKTREGSLGGLVAAVAGAVVCAHYLIPTVPLVDAAILGLVGGAFGQMGDLFESLIKRSTGIKDSGNILPGHGGLLDRVDAMLFTAAVTWIYAVILMPMR